MKIKTKCGLDIYCLPKCGKCRQTGKNPEEMEKCPIFNFDDYGDICVPEVCNHFTFDMREEKEND